LREKQNLLQTPRPFWTSSIYTRARSQPSHATTGNNQGRHRRHCDAHWQRCLH
jgi:hypothetical protein